jgi:hypothetical protein
MPRARKTTPLIGYPAYVDGGIGLPVFRGPHVQHDAQLAAFFFDANSQQLIALCNQYLNFPANGQIKYLPLLSKVVVMFAEMFVASRDERDSQVGRFIETEVTFWIPTMAVRRVGGLFVPDHLAWFVPQLFVDESNSIATGREVYGFNKQHAHIERPASIRHPAFAVDVLGVRHFAPDVTAQRERLLDMRHTGDAPIDERPGTWQSWDDAQTEVLPELLKTVAADSKNKIVEMATMLVTNQMRLVFLKQFRDVADTRLACYQAIVEAPLTLLQFQQGGSLSGDYVLRINPLDSHPLAQKLGLRLEHDEQRASLGLWMKIDFLLGAGIEIWKAS